MTTRRFILVGLLAVVAWSAGGCSSFRRDVRRAQAQTVTEGSIEGLWVGRWEDQAKPGHGGTIEIVLTRTGDLLYRAAARSAWRTVFTSAYDFELVAQPIAPGRYVIQTSKDLWLFGGYRMRGNVNGETLEATYDVAGRTGTLRLARPVSDQGTGVPLGGS